MENIVENAVENMLSIHLTDLCNNNCRFCIVGSPFLRENKVSKDKIFSFLQDNRNQGYKAVNLHGGEPTTRKDFFEILKKIKDCGYPRIILQTNGRKLSKMDYAQKAVDQGITKVVVSVHGSKSEIHDYITQKPGSFKHTIKGIKNMKSLGIHVRTNSVLSKLNDKDFPAIMNVLLKLGVDHVNISAIHTSGTAFSNFDQVVPEYADIYSYLKESVDLITAAGVTLTLEGFPFCVIPGMEKYIINWEYQKFKMLFRQFVLEDYEALMDSVMRAHGEPCGGCHQKEECGGVYNEYIDKFGWAGFGYKKT